MMMRLLLLGPFLVGCAYSPPAEDASCCKAPDPGTMKFHVGGTVAGGVGIGR
jgi:hypothetical protein